MTRFRQTRQVRGSEGRRVIILEEVSALPPLMKQLEVLCRRHPIPIRMKFIGESRSHAGDPMAVYACEYPGCEHREGWVPERHTGRPFRLWGGAHRHSRAGERG